MDINSHAVTVVPTLAPIMTLMACFKVMIPELTCSQGNIQPHRLAGVGWPFILHRFYMTLVTDFTRTC